VCVCVCVCACVCFCWEGAAGLCSCFVASMISIFMMAIQLELSLVNIDSALGGLCGSVERRGLK
jgi:hypothetical protein